MASGPMISLTCRHILTDADCAAGFCPADEVGMECGADIEVETEYTAGGWEGQDADGNRGYWQAAWIGVDTTDARCSMHTSWTEEDAKALQAEADQACADWEPYDARDFD